MRSILLWTYLVEAAFETPLSLRAVVPFLVNDPERDILVRRSRNESDQAGIFFSSGCKGLSTFPSILSLDLVRGRLSRVDQVRIEQVQLVSLHDLWGRVVMVIMSLVVFVPLVTHLHAVEIFRLPWSVLVRPLCFVRGGDLLLGRKHLFILTDTTRDFAII